MKRFELPTSYLTIRIKRLILARLVQSQPRRSNPTLSPHIWGALDQLTAQMFWASYRTTRHTIDYRVFLNSNPRFQDDDHHEANHTATE